MEKEIKINIPAGYEADISGPFDAYLKKIEHAFSVIFISRDGDMRLRGNEESVKKAVGVIGELVLLINKGEPVDEQRVNYAIDMYMSDKDKTGNTLEKVEHIADIDKEIIAYTVTGKPVKPKTAGQKSYVSNIKDRMIVFGVGPAGTGKTYLAMTMAIQAFKDNEVERIILTRPAIEAGEKLGFLPGDLQSKVDPYLRPLYDALNQIMGADSFRANQEKGLIEVAPLAYMRGRTLDNAFIILDEAQNTTPAQMKMFLTRIGFGSKVVVTGDLTQKDLPGTTQSGLEQAVRVLKNVNEIGFSYLTNKDVVRHPLVQKIVMAYDDFDKRMAVKAKKRGLRK